ncbi:hypothetical protein IW140_004095 [Coemansia sp. RSA 1813]|nr:hypothetical protein EV178_004117 [Coemansia sp. RSA 1646]KAJ1768972.1 hypothetical protein LPJ74_004458 [Coemansia sp. RSA 1843]KAJ2088335.1 hypothetical protein IW138_004312 [Coemansia sp. RSA 986]KAJ2568189.1 hypothetical protein IW140_004095 [Coemansia sp. RSA 1813]
MQPFIDFMADSTFLSSMAAHGCYVPNSVEPAQHQQQTQTHAPAFNAIASGFAFERKHVPKRGRSYEEEAEDTSEQQMNEMQRCVYYRKTIVPISAKRAKAVEAHV